MHCTQDHEKLQTLDVSKEIIPLPANHVIILDFGILAHKIDATHEFKICNSVTSKLLQITNSIH